MTSRDDTLSMYNKIAIAYDGSPEAERALATAISVAKMFNAKIAILTAVEDPPLYTGYEASIHSRF